MEPNKLHNQLKVSRLSQLGLFETFTRSTKLATLLKVSRTTRVKVRVEGR